MVLGIGQLHAPTKAKRTTGVILSIINGFISSELFTFYKKNALNSSLCVSSQCYPVETASDIFFVV